MTILMADNDVMHVKLTSFLLEEAGYRVIKVYDGSEVVQGVIRHEPDLVLLDMSISTINGLDLCRQIRRYSDVPIIFLSAQAGLQDRVTSLQIGADDFVRKPFEPIELLARIEAVLRRCSADLLSPTAQLTQGDLTLDPVEHLMIFADGRSQVLTPIEFRLIYYLMKNAGRVLSCDQILEKVWRYDTDGSSNLVAVYIRRLRNKLEPCITTPRYLVTVPYLGYKFVAQDERSLAHSACVAPAGTLALMVGQ